LNQRFQWNGAIYQQNWNHAQVGAFDIDVLGTATINGGNYRVRGIETSGVARVAPGLTIEAGAAWGHSEVVKEASFSWADGTPIDFTTLQTSACQRQTSACQGLSNPAGTLGSPLAGAPPFQGNIRVRYEVTVNGYDAFAQFGAVHQSHSLATTDRLTRGVQGNSIAYDLPPFTTYDGAVGVGKDGWIVQIYGENLTDARAELYANDAQSYKAITVNRPRTVGLRFSYNFRSEERP
jgi:hypothetical protein